MTLFFQDIPPNPGGKQVVCEVGDRYRSMSWNAGKPGESRLLFIKGLEVLEIAR